MPITVGIAKAKNELSTLLNLAAFGGERIILQSRGKPKAAIISLGDLQKLEQLEKSINTVQSQRLFALTKAQRLRERILERRGNLLPDSSDQLSKIRKERADELSE